MADILASAITFKPEISISDIAAIAALISSALVFYFGYNRTRKSEQIKIARELMERIERKTQKVRKIELPEPEQSQEEKTWYEEKIKQVKEIAKEVKEYGPGRRSDSYLDWNPPEPPKDHLNNLGNERVREFWSACVDLLDEIEYFSYLLQIHEIEDKNILIYYIPRINSAFEYMEQRLRYLEKYFEKPLSGIELGYLNMIKKPMKPWLDKYQMDWLDKSHKDITTSDPAS